MTSKIRRLEADDAPIYRAIRLEALRGVPEAFGDDYEDAAGRGVQYWRELLSGEAAFYGAFNGGTLAGIVNFHRDRPRKAAHIGWLYGMYVSPAARGNGMANGLIAAVLDHARELGVLQVHLGVGAFNGPALRLYERMGFERYGTKPRALRVNGAFIDEHHMVRFLDKDV